MPTAADEEEDDDDEEEEEEEEEEVGTVSTADSESATAVAGLGAAATGSDDLDSHTVGAWGSTVTCVKTSRSNGRLTNACPGTLVQCRDPGPQPGRGAGVSARTGPATVAAAVEAASRSVAERRDPIKTDGSGTTV